MISSLKNGRLKLFRQTSSTIYDKEWSHFRRRSIAGFHKLKQEFQQKNNHSAVYVEPVHLPNTTLTVPAAAEFSSDTDVNIYNVKLYGLVYINATNMGTSTVDAEYVAQFRVSTC